jgi:hypothetical protein
MIGIAMSGWLLRGGGGGGDAVDGLVGGAGNARLGGGPTGEVGERTGSGGEGHTRSGISSAPSCGRRGRVGLDGGVGAWALVVPRFAAWLGARLGVISLRSEELAVVEPEAARLDRLDLGGLEVRDGRSIGSERGLAANSCRGMSLLVVGVQIGEIGKENCRSSVSLSSFGLFGGDKEVSGGEVLRLLGLRMEGSNLRSRSRNGGIMGGWFLDADTDGDIKGVGESPGSEQTLA